MSAFLIGFFVNLLCECGRDAEEGDSFSEETNENKNNDGDEDQEAPPVPKKKQSEETVDATPVNPFAEDDDKTSKKNKKKETRMVYKTSFFYIFLKFFVFIHKQRRKPILQMMNG